MNTSASLSIYATESDLEQWAAIIKEEMKILQCQPAPTQAGGFANILANSGKSKSQPHSVAQNLQVAERYSTYDYWTPWKRIRKSGSTDLFTLLHKYQSFIACIGASTMLYSGQPGAGKSVILANMVDHLVQGYSGNVQIAFFFCQWDQTDSLQALTILYCLYRQLVKNRQDRVLFVTDLHTGSFDTRLMTNLLRDALNTNKKTYIVLDGLYECQETERTKVINVLQTLQTHSSLSICLSSRPGTLSHIGWVELHSIYIPEDNPDIELYVDSELSRRFEDGELVVGNPALGGKIRSALKTSANGNFIRVKKQIDLLCEQNTDKDIRQLLADFTEGSFDASDTEALPAPTTLVAPSAFIDSAYASASFTNRSGKNPYDDTGVEESLHGPDGYSVDDSATEYSDVSSTTFSRKRLYISELATDLYNRVSSASSNTGQSAQVSISDTLPNLLKAFALKIGYCATSQMHRDVMAFVHRHRSEITAAFLEICLSQSEVEPGEIRDQSGSMSLQERMDLWDKNEDLDGTSVEEGLESLEIWEWDEEDMYENSDIWVAAYRDFAPNTEAYTWLLTQLQRDMDSTLQEPPAIQLIRDQILSSLPPPHRVSRSIASEPCSVLFEIDWDILDFFDSQEYSKPPDEALPGVITLTGSSSDAQASNCAQFLKQTWPVTGDVMLHVIRDLLKLEQGGPHQTHLPDGTRLAAWIKESKVMVEMDGSAASISETGEQLAWLGAALRSSPRRKGLVYCTPSIRSMYQSRVMPQAVVFEIEFEVEQLPESPDIANGQCWHGIFKNPIIVKGFPILPKLQKNTGLEIPINLMAGLARAKHVDRFNDKVYVKGFSTMLVPTKQFKDVVYWHLIYQEDGCRISYLADNLQRDDDVGSLNLASCRHILGWCSEANFYAGSAQAQYDVRHSELPKPHSQCALAGTIITLGRMIMEGSSFELGIKDTPVHVARNGFIPRLKWISSKFFLLWDENDKRGCLTNGTSALLHVVRASLAFDSTDKFQSAFIFKSDDLQESPKPFTADSAIDVLINPKNQTLKLYPERNGFIVLADRIDQYYNLLEKMLDHQTDITRRHSGNLEKMPRKYLEGWDFEDLSANRDPLHPRLVTLDPAGKGWVDLTRALQAVTLTGRGFGELVRPVGPAPCEIWSQLPRHRYLLACCVSDMEDIVRDRRSSSDDYIRLSDDLIWHNAVNISGRCHCGCFAAHHGEPVHVLFPSTLSHKLCARRIPMPIEGSGAIVFGHNPGFSWIWGDVGPPTQQQPEEEVAVSHVSEGADKDSGVGASLVTSSIRSSSVSRQLSSVGRSPESRAVPLIESKYYARSQYTVGILCALPVELKAIRVLFDQRHQNMASVLGDNNQYALGEISQHLVVATSLPAGEYGTNAAASAISDMTRSFMSIQFCLLVGIAGGAPSDGDDIRLGDVVVSLPTSTFSGVLQYDLGKENEGSDFEVTGVLRRPPRILTNAISKIRSDPDIGFDALNPYLTEIVKSLPSYGNPGQELDVLFRSSCSRRNCKPDCSHLETRLPRLTTEPRIHYGLVASGNRVIKDATLRDRLSRKFGVLCFEMEAAGVMNRADCLVIRGICDYSDAQKNKVWQNYAAAVAAAYAKLLLSAVAVVTDLPGSLIYLSLLKQLSTIKMFYSHIGYFRFEQKPGVTYDRPSFKPVEDAFGDRFKSASISGTTMTVEVYMKDKYYDSTRNEVYDALETMKMNAYFDPTDDMVFETSGDKFVTHWHNGSGRMQECTNCSKSRYCTNRKWGGKA
ncbi:PFS domain-containing protein [Fusarium oxysporum f. sp. phaseoli]